jgi:hypothetical protein
VFLFVDFFTIEKLLATRPFASVLLSFCDRRIMGRVESEKVSLETRRTAQLSTTCVADDRIEVLMALTLAASLSAAYNDQGAEITQAAHQPHAIVCAM